jgi:molybdate transport system substrate-binding protein
MTIARTLLQTVSSTTARSNQFNGLRRNASDRVKLSVKKTFLFAILGILAGGQAVTAQSDSIHVLASGGIKGVLEQIQEQCARTVGHKLYIEYNSTAALKQKIEAGDSFDAVIGASDGLDALSEEGKLAGPHPNISRVGIGIGVRVGAPKLDISSPDSLKRALLDAKSVTYGSFGSSASVVLSMFEKLGIADQMRAKSHPLAGADLITGSVVDGRNQYVLTLVSEILPVKGLELMGTLPPPFQQYTSFAVGLSARLKNPDAAKIPGCFTGPQVASAYKAVGMEPSTGKP